MTPTLEIDSDGYPTEETLEVIREWKIESYADVEVLLTALQSVWRWPSYFRKGQMRKGRRLWRVSTGGWSGHEDMLSALGNNYIFYGLAFWSERRGGHFVFKTERKKP